MFGLGGMEILVLLILGVLLVGVPVGVVFLELYLVVHHYGSEG